MRANAADEQTLELHLREPRNDFLYRLGRPEIFAWPRHVYEHEGRDWHRAIPLVGNGPYVLTYRDENRLVLEAAPSWHGARQNVAEVTIELVASPTVAADRWRRGEYDILGGAIARSAVPDDETVVERSPGMLTWHLGFNARQAPLDDPRVRRALAHAINRKGPAELLQAGAAEQAECFRRQCRGIRTASPRNSTRIAPAPS